MAELALVQTGAEPENARASFDDFWCLYPKKMARKDAMKAWQQLSEADRMAAMVAIVDWRRVWMARDIQYAPHAATWLRGERWTDELPADLAPRPAAQAPAKLAEVGAKTEMPEKVRMALAKMRGQA